MSDSNAAIQSTTSRKRSAAGRIVPAIPLTLSKPRRQTQAQLISTTAAAPPPQQQPSAQSNGVTPQQETSEEHDKVVTSNGTAATSKEEEASLLDNQEDTTPLPGADTYTSQSSAPMSISSGDTQETHTSQTRGGATPPKQSDSLSANMTTEPSPRQQAVDKFDMRQIKTELPPAFVPSSDPQIPQSATHSQSRRNTHVGAVNGHTSHPSASSIVFGAHDSSSSSPAPPRSAGSVAMPPSFHPGQLNTNHLPRLSQPQANNQASPHFPSPHYNPTKGFYPPYHPPSQHPHGQQFRYPPREVFSPTESQMPNGHASVSRSASQSSSVAPDRQTTPSTEHVQEYAKATFYDGRGAFPASIPPRRSFPNRHSLPHPQPPPPDFQSGIENAELVRDQVRANFNNPSLADCHLQISDEEGNRRYLEGHKIILSRSSTLMSLVQSSDPPQSAMLKLQIQIHLTARYVSPSSLLEGLQYLYGGPLLQPERLHNVESNKSRMAMALTHIGTGIWLKVQPIIARGVEIAGSLVHWDTIPQALDFALDGGLSQFWLVEDSEDRASASSDESYSKPEAAGAPTYDPAATSLLHRVVDFTLHVFPPDFFLDTSAPQLEGSTQRLPPTLQGHESRPSRSDPRLSQIRFGEIGVHDTRPSPVTTQLSSMLLSLPYPLLKVILEHPILANRLGSDTVASIMRAVIAEREKRRVRALGGRDAHPFDKAPETTIMQTLQWIEGVETSAQHRAGFKLVRRRKGLDTPVSSGVDSEAGNQ